MPPPPLPEMTSTEIQLVKLTYAALMLTTVFSQTAISGVFTGVSPLDFATDFAAVAALEYMCKRLAMGRRRTTTPSPEAAQTYKARIAAIWKKYGTKLGCAIAFPGNGFLGETPEGASISTWARFDNTQNVHTLEEFQAAGAADAFHQTVHAVMPRHDAAGMVHTLSLTICISLSAFAMLGLAAPLMQVDGHAVTNLNKESKDKEGHLVQPTELARDECYAVALDLLLHGRVAFLFVDGSRGRAALIAYIIKNGGLASPLSQDALRRLGLSLCLMTGLSATNGGSIFLLYIHGYMTIVFLRPSIGSYAFIEYRRNGMHGMLSALMVVHNQTVLLGALMGIELSPFIFDESPLPLIFDTTFQKVITSTLHELKYLAPGNLYRTPMSNGGKASVALAGQWSKKLGRDRFTMEERGEASVALAGQWSEKLGRDRATMEERGHASAAVAGLWSEELGRNRATAEERGHATAAVAGLWSEELGRNRATAEERGHATAASGASRRAGASTEVFIILRHRHSPNLEWSPWLGSRYLYLDDRLDGISRNALAKMLSDAASKEEMLAGRAGPMYFFNLFTVERLRNTTRDSPLQLLDGRLEVAETEANTAPTPPMVVSRRPAPPTVLTKRPAPLSPKKQAPAPKKAALLQWTQPAVLNQGKGY